MQSDCELKAKAKIQIQAATEVNPLLSFLGHGAPGRRRLPLNSQIKQVVFSPNGGQLLQSLARASRPRLYACLAFVECAAVDMPVDDIISFLLSASDRQILEQVLAKVEGPGTLVSPGLRAAMRSRDQFRAHAIGTLNRLLAQGCNVEAALDAASPNRHLSVRAMLGFAEHYNVHALAKLAVHLCTSEREVLALDTFFRRLEKRAPAALPDKRTLLRTKSFIQLSELLQRRIARHRDPLPVPSVSHTRLHWIETIPQLQRTGKIFNNCLKDRISYATSFMLGHSFFGIYTHDADPDSAARECQYILHVSEQWEGGTLVYSILDAKGVNNDDMMDCILAQIIEELTLKTGHVWRLYCKLVQQELLLADWQNAFD